MLAAMIRTKFAILIATAAMACLPCAYSQISATITPGVNPSTGFPSGGSSIAGEPTILIHETSFRVTNNTATQQIVRIDVMVQNANTGQTLTSNITAEHTIAAGETKDIPVNIQTSHTESTAGNAERTIRSNVRSGTTIIHPTAWGFVYHVSSNEDGGGNYYEN